MDQESKALLEETQRTFQRALRTRDEATGVDIAAALGWVTFYLLENRQPSPRLVQKIRTGLTALLSLPDLLVH